MNAEPQAMPGTELSVGGVLGRTFDVLKQNLGIILGLSLLGMLPGAILELLADSSGNSFFSTITYIISAIFSLFVQGAVCYVVFQRMRGIQVGAGEALGRAFSRGGVLILLSILMGLGIFLGFILLIVPGVILLLMWFVAIPACMVEQGGVTDYLKRSSALTKGHRLKLFLICLAIGLVFLVIALVVGGITVAVAGTGSSVAIVLAFLALLLFLPANAFINILPTIVYYDLRNIKEGMNIESLVGVFD